ncbi:energy transducer TonB [Crenobacter luteus]|uniref:energy transducer TonB n=1 Tax=Crenobacter luteus TaxID=1452487 RepID=UPI0012E71034|nr:TonB family protein [Crenobacter luteus]
MSASSRGPSVSVFAGTLLVSALLHLALLVSARLPDLGVPTPPARTALTVSLRAVPPAVAAPVAAESEDEAGRAPPARPPAPRRAEAAAAPRAARRAPTPAAPAGPVPAAPAPRAGPPAEARPVPPPVASEPTLPAAGGLGLLAEARQLARGVGATAEAVEAAPAAAGGRQKAVYGASARGPDWARYLEDWRLKVERVGSLNYPEEARRRQLTGGPLLTVLIDADGGLRSVKVRRSSGQPVLDEAAANIVRLSAPFAPFPPALAERYATLEITRRWTFTADNRLSSQ